MWNLARCGCIWRNEMVNPLQTSREKVMAVLLVVVWAALFLPNLRTNPNWYGDEGEWMEKCWTFIHGAPRVGPITNDFVFPYSYPPFYMLVNGALLKIFGYDIVVSRALGAVTALAAAAILFWIGARLRDKSFGFLCAAAFLVYVEANTNFRWVRSHPMAGTLALASVGFLIRYAQEKHLRDAVWAGIFCALATATNYFTYPLIGAVIVTVAVVNWRHAPLAAVCAGAYGGLFVLWYCATHGGGELMAQVARLNSVASNEIAPTFWGEVKRFGHNIWMLAFRTPTTMDPQRGWVGRDFWLMIAAVGFVWLPVTRGKWLRLWMPFWLLVLMYGVFKKLNNVPLFFYPATIFLPLMAVGFAGALTRAGEWLAKLQNELRWAPAFVAIFAFAVPSAGGAWGHFHTKIDLWTQHNTSEAETAMRFVNAHTTKDDFVIVPKQIYWLAKTERRSMLTFCARYEGVDNDMPVPVTIPRQMFWFDCRCQNAKYVVMASGIDTVNNQPMGIDLVYTSGLKGVPERVEAMLEAGWKPVYVGGSGQMAVITARGHKWPVAVNGEYLVLANPQLAN
jgi:4-amino-4-deoxy-L-arabinose transferase-like glycosyltransferase